jgi:hypothetical protein
MASHIGRRKFLATLGGAAAARGACAATGDAGDRVFKSWVAGVRVSRLSGLPRDWTKPVTLKAGTL